MSTTITTRNYTGTSRYAARGQDRLGTHRTTHMDTLPATFVHSRYRAGWRWLEVVDWRGEQVGGIGLHYDTGERTWWQDTEGGQ